MKAVYYRPADGAILATVSASRVSLDASGLPWLPCPDATDHYARTHRVQDDAVVPIEAAAS